MLSTVEETHTSQETHNNTSELPVAAETYGYQDSTLEGANTHTVFYLKLLMYEKVGCVYVSVPVMGGLLVLVMYEETSYGSVPVRDGLVVNDSFTTNESQR